MLEIEKLPSAATWNSSDFSGEPGHTEESLPCGSSAITEQRGLSDRVTTAAESAGASSLKS